MGQFRLRKKYRADDDEHEAQVAESSKPDKPSKRFRPKTLTGLTREQAVQDAPRSKIEYNPEIGDSVIVKVHDRPKLPKIGAVLGKCKLTKQVGKGSSCWVFIALHQALQIDVAIKIFVPEKNSDIKKFRYQFKIEAQMLAKLNHPNIVRVLDFEDSGLPYMILEYVNGVTLMDRIKEVGALDSAEACRIISCIAAGLQVAHDKDIVHRDIKPENILISKDGSVKLADLGIAMLKSEFRGAQQEKTTSYGTTLCGTPAYVAPEQALKPESSDALSDVYSLGATFFHTITGRYPFDAATVEEMISKHIAEPLTSPSDIRKEIPEDISELIKVMMNKDPKKRFSLHEVISVLNAISRSSETIDDSSKMLLEAKKSKGTKGSLKLGLTSVFSKTKFR
jgi:serine/threonine protein kinase